MSILNTPYDGPVWEVRGLTKRFPGVLANRSIDLSLNRGEIHGLMGENGCGKSTLIKMLMGVHQPDEGKILSRGRAVPIISPTAARGAGIAAVFQEFSLVPTLSVAENIHLGNLPGHRWRIDWAGMAKNARHVLDRLHVEIDPLARVGDLSVAQQQLVEIAKAIATDASMLILDEPTTALGIAEIAELHRVLRRLRDDGTALLYVSHRLDEVVQLVDCVTVLKDGAVVSTAAETPVTVQGIVQAMIGEVADHYPKEPAPQGAVALQLKGVRTANGVNGADLTLHRGEVLGLGGVLGSGRTEIARAIFGVDRLTGGEMLVDGHHVDFKFPRDAVAQGIALVPENRKSDGLFFNFAGLQNMSAAALSKLGPRHAMDLKRERKMGAELIERLAISAHAADHPVGLLSGGNQQKIVIARWLMAGARIFILDEPTQGIDVGAKVAVYRLINELAQAGHAILLISSDHDELMAMSDRIAIVSHGVVSGARPVSEIGKTDLVRASTEEAAA